MARIRAIDGAAPRPVAGPWHVLATAPGACAGSLDLAPDDGWLPGEVPGTAAGALSAAGQWSEAEPTPIHTRDVWYRTPISGQGRERLRFEGLATLAEIWLDGSLVLTSRSMFRAHAVEVDLTPDSELAICFRSLAAELAKPHGRVRWRPLLASPGSLRRVRTSLLGFMPGWCPQVDAVGPYRPVTREPVHPRIASLDLRAGLDDGTGRLGLRLGLDGMHGAGATLRCDGRACALREIEPGLYEGRLELPDIAPWWPHTHGEPRLHAVEAEIGGHRLDLGRVGFRTLALARPFAEGLSLTVNGVPVFCRGACWTPADLVGLSDATETCRPQLERARAAGMNMLRVPGITLYEGAAFHDLCDELGILVWQDLMLANFDYPHDDLAFRDDLVAEVRQFLDRTQASPSLCVLCGGSEVWQQAAMLGLPSSAWSGGFVAETLPALAAELRPDIVVVPNSPSGGDLPFSVGAGVTHYYGVGAYRRPLKDARRAGVGFASECLAFANVPEPETLRRAGLADPNSERWRAAIPRDRGADWTFEDVRDHYVASLYRVDPEVLRTVDPELYLALGRAAVAEVMEATFAEWRRPGSRTAGGLVLLLRDLAPGAGWGVLDHEGFPKSAWYALRRAFRPIHFGLSDEGLDGLHVHVVNETGAALDGHLRLAFASADGRTIVQAGRAIRVEPRGAATWSSADLLGRFFDATYAYRFGPPAHALGHVTLSDAAGNSIAEAFHFPHGREIEPGPIGLRAELVADGEWAVRITADRCALCVQIEVEDRRVPGDNWFHLAPGCERIVPLPGAAPPRGRVRALNAVEVAEFGG